MTFFIKVMRKLGLQRLCFILLHTGRLRGKRKAVWQDTEKAYARLARISPDVGGSSLCNNQIKKKPEYDLQIVVPAYNEERYIGACMDSILRQVTDYRVLVVVVDDGSADGTASIVDAYAGVKNVRVIHQANRGFSGARNAALGVIEAKYVMFVDGDDMLASGAVEVLLDEAFSSGADIVEGSFVAFSAQGRSRPLRHRRKRDAKVSDLFGYVCGKVFSARLFARVRFPEGYWFEDTICVYLLHPCARRIVTVDNIVYLYRRHGESISEVHKGSVRTLDALYVTRHVLRDAHELGMVMDEELYEAFLVDVKVNLSRFVWLAEGVHRDVFAATCALRRAYFPHLRARNGELRALEGALDSGDYEAYRLFGRCYMGCR